MKNYYRKALMSMLFFLLALMAHAQTSISGKVKDANTGEALPGTNIVVKGRVIGTTSDAKGNFSLKTTDPPPFTLSITYVGYQSQEINITDANVENLEIAMQEQVTLGQEVVVSASRIEESILQAPVTIEKLDGLAIR